MQSVLRLTQLRITPTIFERGEFLGNEIDRLEVRVEAQTRDANSQLDTLIRKLSAVKEKLGSLNAVGLNGLPESIRKLGLAMKQMNDVKTTDFTRLAKNIERIGNINTVGLGNAANSLMQVASSFAELGNATGNINSLAQLAAGLTKLGGKGVSSTIENMPKLSAALLQMITTLSGAPTVSNNVVQMTNALASLSANGSKVSQSVTNLTTGFKQYADSTRKATIGSRSLASVLGKMYSNFFWIKNIVGQLKNSLTESMDYIEEYNYYNVTMEKVGSEWSGQWQEYGYDNAESYANSFQNRMSDMLGKMSGFQINKDGTLTDTKSANLGLDVTALTNYSAGLMQVTNSLGLTGEASTATTKALSMLAGDMSSFRNLDLSTVMTNFQSGLIGQSRALYKYGIDITNATLSNYAYELSLSKSVAEMTQAEKMQLRMLAILDQSKVAWGDLANTINSPSNQIRLLQNNFKALSRTVGNIFLPVVAKVLPYVNGLTIAVSRLFTWIGSLLGVDLSGIIGDSSAGYTDAFDGIADDAADNIDGATDSAKKLKNELMGFDEINKLSDNADSGENAGNSSGGGTIDLTDQLTAALKDYETVWNEAFGGMQNTANGFADDIEDFFVGVAQYAQPSVDAIKRLWDDGFKKFRNFGAQGCKDFMNEFLMPLGKWTLGSGFPQLVDATNDFLNDIDWPMMNDNLKKFWKVMEPFAEGVGQGLIDFYKGLTKIGAPVIKTLGKAIGKFADYVLGYSPSTIKSIGEAFGLLLGTFAVFKTIVGLATGIQTLSGSVSLFFGALSAHPYALIAAGITGVLIAITGLSQQSGAEDVLKEINDQFYDTVTVAEKEAETSKKLADEYSNLAEKAELTNTEKQKMQEIAEQLVEYYPELEQYYNGETGLLEANKEKIEDVIDAKLHEIKIKAYEDKLIALEKKKLEIQDKLNSAHEKQNDLSSKNAKYLKGLNKQYQSLGDAIDYVADMLTGKVAENASEFKANTAQLAEYEKQLDEIDGEIEKTVVAYNNLSAGAEGAAEANGNLAENAENSSSNILASISYLAAEAGIQFGQMGINIKTIANDTGITSATNLTNGFLQNIQSVPESAQNVFNQIAQGFDANGLGSGIGLGIAGGVADGIAGQQWNIQNAIKNAFRGLSIGAAAGITIGLNLPQFAAGGFPEEGPFLMNRGEIVGKFKNGKSAVANNGQITEGIAAAVGPAVYNAVMQAMANYGGTSIPQVQVLVGGQEVTDVVVKEINSTIRETGQCPILI